MPNKVFQQLSWQIIVKNWKHFLLTTFILFVSIVMFLSLAIPIFTLGQNLNNLNKTQNVEDFNIQILNDLKTNQVKDLEKTFDLKFQKTQSKVFLLDNKNYSSYLQLNQKLDLPLSDKNNQLVSFNPPSDKYALIVSSFNKNINKPYLNTELKNDQICIDQSTYIQRNYNKNSTITINNKKLKVVSCVFVNYTYPVETLLLPNTKIMALASVNDDTFAKLSTNYTKITYHGKFNKQLSFNQRSELYKKFINTPILKQAIVLKINDKKLNSNIAIAQDKIVGSQISTLVMVLVITLLAIIVVASLINRLLVSDKETLGVLKALGYENQQITNIYLLYPLIATLIASILAISLSSLLTKMLLNLYAIFFSIPKVGFINNLFLDICYVTIIFIILFITTKIKLSKTLNIKTLDLLNNNYQSKINLDKISKTKQKQNFIKQIQYLNFKFNKNLFIYFVMSSIVSSLLIYLAFSMGSIYQQFTVTDQKFVEQTQQLFVKKQPMLNKAGEFNKTTSLLTKVNNKNNSNSDLIEIWGLNFKQPNFKLISLNNKRLQLKDNDIVISKKLAIFLNLKQGDLIEVKTITNEQSKSFKITNVIQTKETLAMYMSNKVFNKNFNNNINSVSGRYTNDKYKDSEVIKISTDKLNKLSNDFKLIQFYSIGAIMLFALLIGATLIYVVIKSLIFKNKAMFDTLTLIGYTPNELKTIIVAPFYKWIVICGLLTYPLLVLSLNQAFILSAKSFNMIISLDFDIITWIGAFIVYVLVFLTSIYFSTKNITKGIK